MSKKGLGRGLGALIPEVEVGEKDRESITELEIHSVEPNPRQPRKNFDQARLEELAASIREHGVVQPIVVRPKGGRYEIVAGERRWRASQLAGLKKVPALVREFSEAETMEIALIENLQREDLNPLEEAEAYRILLDEYHLTQDELAQRLGKSRPQITNTLRLLQLSPVARAEVESGRISMGHAKVLLGLESVEEQNHLARKVAETGLSVRELEVAVKAVQGVKRTGAKRGAQGLTYDLLAVQTRLSEFFGTPVKLIGGEEKGKIEITFFGAEGLNRILEAVGLPETEASLPPKSKFRI
ncbi:MAG TPA: ParB/RepB/Spo0J family partition protein [Symbiobacteriaceae bacterium]|jgi:ParB family transcriptional regulator, chromosome partitioning protein|nr:ParB/RepB/Spo0J family partition protein [Symbiobacteriaceae bacterium]